MSTSYLFTSESVSEGHPDKLADRISDTVLDRFLAVDPKAKVACETFIADSLVVVAGEFHTTPDSLFDQIKVEIPELVREVIRDTGYTADFPGIDPNHCEILTRLNQQSSNIRDGVEIAQDVIGAGDQGLVFGYATDETPEMLPLPMVLAHQLLERLTDERRAGQTTWLRPDSKAQVSVCYVDDKPISVETVVLSTQHSDEVETETVRNVITERVINPVVPVALRGSEFRILVNPTGRFVVGGPKGDTGLTGRKIVVDTYGGRCPHGGGAFSGKDPTKVDRSAAYMARYVAKNIVAAGLANRCTLQIAYAIGVPEPVSVYIDLHHTGQVSDDAIRGAVLQVFDLTPAGIIRTLNLRRPIYAATAVYGHFGRPGLALPWESTDKVAALQHALNKKMVEA